MRVSTVPPTKTLWILGAPSSEMDAIQNLLELHHQPYHLAADSTGNRVIPQNKHYITPPLGVECYGMSNIILVDCGFDDDPELPIPVIEEITYLPRSGLSIAPEEYIYTSPIWRVWEILKGIKAGNRKKTYIPMELRYIAASVYDIYAAYRGKCHGVDPNGLFFYRTTHLAKKFGLNSLEVCLTIDAIAGIIRSRPRLDDHCNIYDLRNISIKLAPSPSGEEYFQEAVARYALSFCTGPITHYCDHRRGRYYPFLLGVGRYRVQSDSAEDIHHWMKIWAPEHGLIDICGSPGMNAAEGYLPI